VFVRVLALCLFAALAAFSPARADEALIVGVMNDHSGPYADLSGPGGAAIARMAIEDFGGTVLGKPIELLVADHQNKVDVGLQVARQWYDERRVRAIFDITNSGVALALQDLAKARNRIVIFDSAASSDLTGKACSPNGIQWNADNWSNGVALMRLLIDKGLDSFFFITADYAFGASLEADARDAIMHAGGTVVGAVRSPLNTADFSSYLVGAQASKAKVIVFAIAGADLLNALKQASEFRNISPPQLPISATSTQPDSTSPTTSPSCNPGIGTSTIRRALSPSAFSPAASACRTTTRSRSTRPSATISRRSPQQEPTIPNGYEGDEGSADP
jgi:branched-chain amino acid transport system substrate-binding protein